MNPDGVLSGIFRKCAPLALAALATALALALGELAIRWTVNPGDFLIATTVEDPVLGQRIAPGAPGHDILGFRNASIPQRARIVAVGDSQTYGVGVPRAQSWPQQLAGLLGEPVYNMGLGGYGPLEYLHVARQARQLKPRVLLVGFYFGNDLAEACRAAHQRPHWQGWREGDPSVDCDPQAAVQTAAPRKRFGAIRDWLSRHSVLYSVLRVTLLAPLASCERDDRAKSLPQDRQWLWSDPAQPLVRTIFTAQARLSVLDPRLARVQEGLRLTKQALGRINDEARERGTQLLVILIPTKERAFCAYLERSQAAMPAAFASLCKSEETIKQDLARFLSATKISHVDATPALEEQVGRHVQIYPTDADGHPRTAGYAVIARVAYDALRLRPELQ